MVGNHVSRKDTHPSAEYEAMQQSLSHELWKIVIGLPAKYREVLVLNGKYDMSQREIAQLLGLSEGTVKTRLLRARQKVADAWKEDLVHERA